MSSGRKLTVYMVEGQQSLLGLSLQRVTNERVEYAGTTKN